MRSSVGMLLHCNRLANGDCQAQDSEIAKTTPCKERMCSTHGIRAACVRGTRKRTWSVRAAQPHLSRPSRCQAIAGNRRKNCPSTAETRAGSWRHRLSQPIGDFLIGHFPLAEVFDGESINTSRPGYSDSVPSTSSLRRSARGCIESFSATTSMPGYRPRSSISIAERPLRRRLRD